MDCGTGMPLRAQYSLTLLGISPGGGGVCFEIDEVDDALEMAEQTEV